MHLAGWVPPPLRRVLDRLAPHGVVYLVGGAVHDFMSGQACGDVDAAYGGDVATLRRLGGVAIAGPAQTHAWRTAAGVLEVSPLVGGDVRQDTARRDLTMHAVLLRWPDGDCLDPAGGRRDRAARRLRTPAGADPFAADPVRVLRAFRRVGQGMRIEPRTAAAMRAAVPALAQAPRERVGTAMVKLLVAPQAGAALRAMAAWPGLLGAIAPAFAWMPRLPAPSGHRHDVWRHSTYVIDALPCDAAMRLAALWHDTGKVTPWLGGTPPADGRPLSEGHTARSARLADQVLRTWGIDRGLRQRALALVAAHTFSATALLADMGELRAWVATHEAYLGDLLAFRRADRYAAGTARPADDIDALAAACARVQGEDFPRRPADMAVDTVALLERHAVPPRQRAQFLDALWRWVLAEPERRNNTAAIAARTASPL